MKKLNRIHAHTFHVQPPKPNAGVFVRELKLSPRKGLFGVLSQVKSIYGGPTELVSFHYSPKHATRHEAEAAANEYARRCQKP